jgi:hypothetical protein
MSRLGCDCGERRSPVGRLTAILALSASQVQLLDDQFIFKTQVGLDCIFSMHCPIYGTIKWLPALPPSMPGRIPRTPSSPAARYLYAYLLIFVIKHGRLPDNPMPGTVTSSLYMACANSMEGLGHSTFGKGKHGHDVSHLPMADAFRENSHDRTYRLHCSASDLVLQS